MDGPGSKTRLFLNCRRADAARAAGVSMQRLSILIDRDPPLTEFTIPTASGPPFFRSPLRSEDASRFRRPSRRGDILHSRRP
jgi:hypothetical protein